MILHVAKTNLDVPIDYFFCWAKTPSIHVQVPMQGTTLEAVERLKAELRTPIFMSLIILSWGFGR